MRLLLVFVGMAIVLYVGFSLMLFLLQDRLVFLPHMPGRALETTPEALSLDYEDAWIGTEDGERLHRISIPESRESGLLWSPDGKKLAFSATVEGERGFYTVEFPDLEDPKRSIQPRTVNSYAPIPSRGKLAV